MFKKHVFEHFHVNFLQVTLCIFAKYGLHRGKTQGLLHVKHQGLLHTKTDSLSYTNLVVLHCVKHQGLLHIETHKNLHKPSRAHLKPTLLFTF